MENNEGKGREKKKKGENFGFTDTCFIYRKTLEEYTIIN